MATYRGEQRRDNLPARTGNSPLQAFQRAMEAQKARMVGQLAKGINLEAQIGAVLAAMRSNEQLLGCTQESLIAAVYQASRMGVNLHPDLKHGYLVPFRGKDERYSAQLIVSARGLLHQAVAAGTIRDGQAACVYQGDRFDYGRRFEAGKDASYLEHRPAEYCDPSAPLTHVYVWFTMPDGSVKWTVVGRSVIDNIRSRSRAGNGGPWVTDFAAMAEKTAVKQAFRYIPLSIDVAEVVAADDRADMGEAITAEGEVIEAVAVEAQPDPEPKASRPKPAPKAPAQEEIPSIPDDLEAQWQAELADMERERMEN